MSNMRFTILSCLLFVLFDATLQQTLPSERSALIQLRSSLGLRSKQWPIKSDPCSSWNGIQCLDGRVLAINISGFNRTRTAARNPQFAVDSLANLTLLASFNASGFRLPGPIPDWFGLRLPALRLLDLRSCSVTDAIPSSLGALNNLTTLLLSWNSVTGTIPSSIGQLSSLSFLDLSHNFLTGPIPSSFSSLLNLTLLDLSSNFLSGVIPPVIGSLSNMRSLSLSNNNLSSSIPSSLGALNNLTTLLLSWNSVTGTIPSSIGQLSSLSFLDLSHNFLTGPIPSSFSSLLNLTLLDLSSNFLDGVIPPFIGSLSNMRSLSLSNNSLSSSIPSQLGDLLNLVHLDLSFNSLSGTFPAALWSITPELVLLDVSNNMLTGTLSNFSLNSKPTALLNLSSNMFYGGLTTLVQNFNLTDLSSNYFQGIVPNGIPRDGSLDRNCLTGLSNQRTAADCSSFYSDKGIRFDNFGLPNASSNEKRSRQRLIILVAVLGGAGIIALLAVITLLIILCRRKKKEQSSDQRGIDVQNDPSSTTSPGYALNFSHLGEGFTYEKILRATDNFSNGNLIKKGHSGDLYRGLLENGTFVVIKRVDLLYESELGFFSRVSHPRFVPLLGYCLEKENEKFLVYKHMPNGDLVSSFYRKKKPEDEKLQSLDWITRLKVAIGAAEALSYLHHECSPPIIHRDVRASSILLDNKFEVRLGSLGSIRLQEDDANQKPSTRLSRLPQASDQSSSGSSKSTFANDVYCFGKVLLELITGKIELDGSSDESAMKEWLEASLPCISIYDKELITNIVDPSLIIDEDLLEEVWSMAVVAKSCLNPKPSRRPLMRYVVKALENPLKVIRVENTNSGKLRTISSTGSWSAAFLGSWRNSSSSEAAAKEGIIGRSISRGGGGQNAALDHSSSMIFPEANIC